ncbi:MAG: GntR family transcriptional regulator [Anaerolineae bacterium]
MVEQVKTHLKQRINNHEFAGDRVPPELELADELQVSRNTIRDALSRLEMEGVIYRRQGAGTFINPAVRLVKTRLEEIIPYETLISEQGFAPAVHLHRVESLPADPATAKALNLEPASQLLLIEKLYLADGEPVIFSQVYLPCQAITQPYTPADLLEPIFDLLPRLCQNELSHYLSELVPVLATDDLTTLLNLPQPVTALLSFSEIGHTTDGAPIISARSYFRSDMLRLRLIRRMPTY